MSISPRTQTVAYLIWHDCEQHEEGWNRTVAQIAESIDRPEVTAQRVRRALGLKGWQNRVRVTRADMADLPGMNLSADEDAGRIISSYQRGVAA